MAITGRQLRETLLGPAMLHYFGKKLPDLAPAELEARVEETLKFLAIARFCSGPIPVTREIDDVWHYWILQTEEYQRLCAALPGGEFIHHSSNDYLEYADSEIAARDNVANDVKALADYVRNFGPFQESRVRYWAYASHLLRRLGWSVDDLNDWLASAAVVAVAPR